MKLSVISFLAAAGYAAANPFAPKVTPNNAASKYASKLVRGAQTIRGLEEGQQGNIDLSSYSVKFEKCQFVKEFAGGNQQGGGGNNNNQAAFLTTKRFVIFRLCPNNSCSGCTSNYGEYLVALDTYLQATTEYVQEIQNNKCEVCNQCYEMAYNNNGNNNGDNNNANMCQNVDTSTCYEECQNIANMENNGYVDATDFVECQQIQQNNNNGDNGNGQVYYAGAMCASSGTRIKIGVFYDQYCSVPADSLDIESMLGYNENGAKYSLSYHALKAVFPESSCVASCLAQDENANNNDNNGQYQQAQTAEICQNLYQAAGKCESTHGFSAMKYYNGGNNGDNNGQNQNGYYYNQQKNEEAVCNYMQNVKSGIYDMTGEISISGGRSVAAGGSSTTGGQKFALTFFALGTAVMAGYAAMLHSQLVKGSKASLSGQGGAMA